MVELSTIAGPEDVKRLPRAELPELARSIRSFLIDSVSRTGGHIGANLGTVELTVALHRVFDSPGEPLVWDTGHQGYAHKLLTGRAALFPTLNTYGGMNRFVSKSESVHDPIEASHAGTALSVALGMALGRRLRGDARPVVAIVGDGALVEGLTLEALNHAAVEDVNLVLVLNDNGYAISPGFGAVHRALQSTDERAAALFGALGIEYVGPLDGHDVLALADALASAREAGGLALLHVKTEKGHGWKPADGHPFRMHFSFPFDPVTGAPRTPPSTPSAPRASTPAETYPDVAARAVLSAMERDERIVALTPSTLYATGLAPAFARFPERCFDPGMEEQHALTLTVGLALEGFLPVIAYQSTFLQRAFDQLVHDVCFANLPTLILAVRTGFAGYDNPTHHGIYDFAWMRGLPNLRALYPKDRYETERMVRDALRDLSGPTVIHMPYGPVDAFEPEVLAESAASFARAQVVQSGGECLVVAVGHKFAVAREVVATLRARGVDAGLVNLRQIKPLPEEQLAELFASAQRVVSLEEAVLDGGVGSALAALIADRALRCELLRAGVPCRFVEPGSNAELCAKYELDVPGVLARIARRWPALAEPARRTASAGRAR